MKRFPLGPNRLLRLVNRIYCRFWHRLPPHVCILPDGPLILVGNHRSGLDPLLIQAAVNRPLCFLMAREYYESMWYMRWLFDLVGAIPVNPGGANRHALERAVAAVNDGNALCMFPEGEANPAIPLRRIFPGAVIIARETGAPLIPFHVSGSWPFDHVHIWRPFLRRGRARVRVGDPIELPEGLEGKDTLWKGCQLIRHAIHALAYRS